MPAARKRWRGLVLAVRQVQGFLFGKPGMDRPLNDREAIDLLLPVVIPTVELADLVLKLETNLCVDFVGEFQPQISDGFLRGAGNALTFRTRRHKGKEAIGQAGREKFVGMEPTFARLEKVLREQT